MSLHENYADFWLMRKSATEHDYKSAIYYADVLLRTNPQSSAYVVPILAQISEDKAGVPLVKAVLADNPPWRKQFLSMLPQNVTDPRTPLDLLLALRTVPCRPRATDIASYLNRPDRAQILRLGLLHLVTIFAAGTAAPGGAPL